MYMNILSKGEKNNFFRWFSKQARWGGFSAGSGDTSPAHTSARSQDPAPTPAVQLQEGVREWVQGLEPLSGSHCSPSVLKNFLGKWVSFTAWEMQPTAKGRTAPHVPTTVPNGLLIWGAQGVEYSLMDRDSLKTKQNTDTHSPRRWRFHTLWRWG